MEPDLIPLIKYLILSILSKGLAFNIKLSTSFFVISPKSFSRFWVFLTLIPYEIKFFEILIERGIHPILKFLTFYESFDRHLSVYVGSINEMNCRRRAIFSWIVIGKNNICTREIFIDILMGFSGTKQLYKVYIVRHEICTPSNVMYNSAHRPRCTLIFSGVHTAVSSCLTCNHCIIV